MKKIAALASAMVLAWSLKAQITILEDDMPQPGDTIRKSITTDSDGIDYEQTGPGHTWDFSELSVMYQQVDTFESVGLTPAIYQLVFNNQFLYPDYKATVAKKMSDFNFIPGLDLSDSYQFFKNSSQDFREVGLGVTLNGLQLPVPYQLTDAVYRFPLSFGRNDTSFSMLEYEIPGMGYLLSEKNRINEADGWGTLITPFGQFEVLRMKSTINEYDSLYSDSLGTGFPVNRNIIEYKWLGKGTSVPLLQVSEEGPLVTIAYVDSVRSLFFGEKEYSSPAFDFTVYPNPCTEYFSVSYELFSASPVRMMLISIDGNLVFRLMESRQERGLYSRVFYPAVEKIPSGFYLIRVEAGKNTFTRRLIVQ